MMRNLFYLVLSVVVLAGCHKDDDDDNEPKIGKDFTERVEGVDLKMVYVKGGTFAMGATVEQDDDYDSDEKPVHQVTLSDYYMAAYPVTQGLWKAVMGTTIEEQCDKAGSSSLRGKGDNYPMYYVNWEEALEFCTKLSRLTGKTYALPTEAQWEYAARGGEKSKGYKYSGSNDIDEVAWYWENSSVDGTRMTHAVGQKKANELGIYDMSGNVWEWCQDWYDDYDSEAQVDPVGPATGSYCVLRGGGWISDAEHCRVSDRHNCIPGFRLYDGGFRLVLVP